MPSSHLPTRRPDPSNMTFSSFITGLAFAASALACPGHDYHGLRAAKRQDNIPNVTESDWAYEFSFNWGRLNPGNYSQVSLYPRHGC